MQDPHQELDQHGGQQGEADLEAVAEMIEPAERDEAARLGRFFFLVFFAYRFGDGRFFLRAGFSASSSSSASSTARQPKPAASASAVKAATPIRIAMTKRVTPESGPPNNQAGARRMKSPTTPPRPVGSGQALLGGRQEAKPAAAKAPTTHRIVRARADRADGG